MNKLIQTIEQWGEDRNIIGPDAKATLETQFLKLEEEVSEIHEAIAKKDDIGIVDGIGDAVVVLTLLARLAGTDLEACVNHAYHEIKNRTGKMENGMFVKDE